MGFERLKIGGYSFGICTKGYGMRALISSKVISENGRMLTMKEMNTRFSDTEAGSIIGLVKLCFFFSYH